MKLAVVLVNAVSLLVIAPIAYMLSDNVPPYVYDAERSYVVPEMTTSGHQMLVHWQFKKVNRVCPGVVIRVIVDAKSGARIVYDPTPVAHSVHDDEDYLDRTFYLPPGISPGVKFYKAEIEFFCNPIQRIWPLRVQTPGLHFVIVEDPETKPK